MDRSVFKHPVISDSQVLISGMEYTMFEGDYLYPQFEGKFAVFSKDDL